MPKFSVMVTRTTTETAEFEVSAVDSEVAEAKVREWIEPDFSAMNGDIDAMKKAETKAERKFSSANDSSQDQTEYEYETSDI